ncbi:hypothetical protein BJY52DRAFT_1311098 [Lactarius psammicola]|nr:hypothetical protein BJY52DRAFT_1311098 [Lactarius psammicola]
MTESEILHMTSGILYSTIAGSISSAYISLGVPAQNLITASIMSISRAHVPKLEEPTTRGRVVVDRGEDRKDAPVMHCTRLPRVPFSVSLSLARFFATCSPSCPSSGRSTGPAHLDRPRLWHPPPHFLLFVYRNCEINWLVTTEMSTSNTVL